MNLSISHLLIQVILYYYRVIDPILLMVRLIKNLNIHLDINECEISNGGCEHQCKNTNGSYVCECNTGFSLDGNGKTCTGKFENKIDAEVLP